MPAPFKGLKPGEGSGGFVVKPSPSPKPIPEPVKPKPKPSPPSSGGGGGSSGTGGSGSGSSTSQQASQITSKQLQDQAAAKGQPISSAQAQKTADVLNRGFVSTQPGAVQRIGGQNVFVTGSGYSAVNPRTGQAFSLQSGELGRFENEPLGQPFVQTPGGNVQAQQFSQFQDQQRVLDVQFQQRQQERQFSQAEFITNFTSKLGAKRATALGENTFAFTVDGRQQIFDITPAAEEGSDQIFTSSRLLADIPGSARFDRPFFETSGLGKEPDVFYDALTLKAGPKQTFSFEGNDQSFISGKALQGPYVSVKFDRSATYRFDSNLSSKSEPIYGAFPNDSRSNRNLLVFSDLSRQFGFRFAGGKGGNDSSLDFDSVVYPLGIQKKNRQELQGFSIPSFVSSFQERIDTGFSDTQSDFISFSESTESNRQFNLSTTGEYRAQSYALGLSYLGFRTFSGFKNVLVHPIESAKGIPNILNLNPEKNTIVQANRGLEEDPIGFIAELGGGAVAGKFVYGPIASKSPVKPALIRQNPLTESGRNFVGFGIRVGEKTVPLAGLELAKLSVFAESKIITGKPGFELSFQQRALTKSTIETLSDKTGSITISKQDVLFNDRFGRVYKGESLVKTVTSTPDTLVKQSVIEGFDFDLGIKTIDAIKTDQIGKGKVAFTSKGKLTVSEFDIKNNVAKGKSIDAQLSARGIVEDNIAQQSSLVISKKGQSFEAQQYFTETVFKEKFDESILLKSTTAKGSLLKELTKAPKGVFAKEAGFKTAAREGKFLKGGYKFADDGIQDLTGSINLKEFRDVFAKASKENVDISILKESKEPIGIFDETSNFEQTLSFARSEGRGLSFKEFQKFFSGKEKASPKDLTTFGQDTLKDFFTSEKYTGTGKPTKFGNELVERYDKLVGSKPVNSRLSRISKSEAVGLKEIIPSFTSGGDSFSAKLLFADLSGKSVDLSGGKISPFLFNTQKLKRPDVSLETEYIRGARSITKSELAFALSSKSSQKQLSGLGVSQLADLKINQLQKLGQISGQSSKTAQLQQDLLGLQSTALFAGTIQGQRQDTLLQQLLRQNTRQLQRQKSLNFTTGLTVNYGKSFAFNFSIGKGSRRLSKAYNVLVRRKGKFVKVAKGLPKNKALKFGADVAEEYIQRSFRLEESGVTSLADLGSFTDSFKFRQPKGKSRLPRDTFIEKSKFAINTGSEKRSLKLGKKFGFKLF